MGRGDRAWSVSPWYPQPAPDQVGLVYERTGNFRAVQILLGHTKLESTVRYLGADAEDAVTLSEATEI